MEQSTFKKRMVQHRSASQDQSTIRTQTISFTDLPPELRNHIYELLAEGDVGQKVLCWQQGLRVARPKLLRINQQTTEEAVGYLNKARWRLKPIDLAKFPPLFPLAQGQDQNTPRAYASSWPTRYQPALFFGQKGSAFLWRCLRVLFVWTLWLMLLTLSPPAFRPMAPWPPGKPTGQRWRPASMRR